MFVVLDDRPLVAGGCVACFEREGIAAIAVEPAEFQEWFELVSDADIAVVEGVMALAGTPHRLDRDEGAYRDARSLLARLR